LVGAQIEIDLDNIIRRLDELEARVYKTAKESMQIISSVDQARDISYREMLGYARVGFNALDAFLGMFGIAVPQAIKMVVNTVLMSAGPLIQLATGEIALGNPAAIGAIVNITSAIVMAQLMHMSGNQGQQELMATQQFVRNVMNLWGRSV
jgi:hypothetical protein